tara:strand:- start:2485 stop:2901 length:417 start_codon:yes stop_codon:yes gene_type:complete
MKKADGIDNFVIELQRRGNLIEAEIQTLKNEITRMKIRKKAIERIKQYLTDIIFPMIVETFGNNGIYETNTARYKLFKTFGKVIIDESCKSAQKRYLKAKIEDFWDKAQARKDIMLAYKDNKKIEGVTIKRLTKVRRS